MNWAEHDNVKDSARVLRRLNGELCRENGLSVIEHPAKHPKAFGEGTAIKHSVSRLEARMAEIAQLKTESNQMQR